MYRIISLTLLAGLLSACTNVQDITQGFIQKPSVKIEDVQFTPQSLMAGEAIAVLAINNPNPVGAQVKDITYRLALGERDEVVEGQMDSGIKIPAGGAANVDVPIGVDIHKAFDSVLELANRQRLPYRLSGDIGIGPTRIPYSQSGELPLPQLPTVSLDSIEVAAIGLGGARLLVHLLVGNPNDFPLPLGQLHYNLQLDDRSIGQGAVEQTEMLEAGSETPVGSSLQVDFLSAGQALMGILRQDQTAYALQGEMSVGQGDLTKAVPFDINGQVPLKR